MRQVFVGGPHDTPTAFALIIDGTSLQFALTEWSDLFLELCDMCESSICCRATPLQKSKVVALVQNQRNKIGLGIGDGANDVSMLQEAKVGVGVFGREGTQAARAADFAIPEFRFHQY